MQVRDGDDNFHGEVAMLWLALVPFLWIVYMEFLDATFPYPGGKPHPWRPVVGVDTRVFMATLVSSSGALFLWAICKMVTGR